MATGEVSAVPSHMRQRYAYQWRLPEQLHYTCGRGAARRHFRRAGSGSHQVLWQGATRGDWMRYRVSFHGRSAEL